MSIWDSPELKIGGEYVTFDKPGDSVSGTIQVIRVQRFDDGAVHPQILLVTDQGEERTVTAGQIRLKTELAQQRPEAGDWIRITHTQVEKRAGGKTLKHFAVEVRRGGAAGAPAASTIGQQAPNNFGVQPPAPAPAAGPIAALPQQFAAQGQAIAAAVPQTAPAPPAVPQPAPQAAPAAPAPAGLTPEQQAAIAALTPEQRAAMGFA